MTDVHRDTIMRLGLTLGIGAERLHNRIARGLSCSLIQCDEIWSYVQKKQARVTPEDGPDVGEAYTFVALDASSRFVIAWYVGKRNEESCQAFMNDVRARLVVMPAMTSDGFAPYISAIGASFGPGAPNLETASTAYVERQNGTMRHHIGRMRRLCLAFSKKLDNHRAAVALAYAHYNFCHVASTLRVTPAMAVGLTSHVWSLAELEAALLTAGPCEAPERQPLAPRVPETTARELPNGRGFLRVFGGGKGGSTPATSAPAPPPATTPVVPTVTPVGATASAAAWEQLDLLSWRPKPPPKGQLSLFDDPI